jgi:hypothetical protein
MTQQKAFRDLSGGTYWRFAWSRDWADKAPWSLDGVPMPYIGSRVSRVGAVKLRVFGPISLVSVTL